MKKFQTVTALLCGLLCLSVNLAHAEEPAPPPAQAENFTLTAILFAEKCAPSPTSTMTAGNCETTNSGTAPVTISIGNCTKSASGTDTCSGNWQGTTTVGDQTYEANITVSKGTSAAGAASYVVFGTIKQAGEEPSYVYLILSKNGLTDTVIVPGRITKAKDASGAEFFYMPFLALAPGGGGVQFTPPAIFAK